VRRSIRKDIPQKTTKYKGQQDNGVFSFDFRSINTKEMGLVTAKKLQKQ
jgi:hypothetical protein